MIYRILKKISICVAALACMLSCTETKLEEPIKQEHYMKLYGTYYYDHLTSIDMTPQEELVITAYRIFKNGKEETWLSKTDRWGMTEWKKYYAGENNNYRGYAKFSDGNIYFSGYIGGNSPEQGKGFYCKYGLDGNLLDSITFEIMADKIKGMYFLTKGTNKQLLVHGNKNNRDFFSLYKISADTIDRTYNYPLSNNAEERIYFYEEGERVYVTASLKEGSESDNTNIFIYMISNGIMEWETQYGKRNRKEIASGIHFANDSIHILTTVVHDNNATNLYMLKFNKVGRNPSSTDINLKGNFIAYDMQKTKNNELIVTGDQIISEKNTLIFAARVNEKGQVILKNKYGLKGMNRGLFSFEVPNKRKSFIVAGDLNSSAAHRDACDVIVLKLNENLKWAE